jgi:FkbM family methyltransferase
LFQLLLDLMQSPDWNVARASRRVRDTVTRFHDPLVTYRLNGRSLKLPLSHGLPWTRRTLPLYADNLRRLAAFVRERHGSLRMIDVGANVGDSYAQAGSLPGDAFLLVEGSERFFPLLERNTRDDPAVTRVLTLLSDRCEDLLAELVEDQGNASLRTGGVRAARLSVETLDRLLEAHPGFRSSNLLKVDVEGHDRRVLLGARGLLAGAAPVLLFEHQPRQLTLAGEDDRAVFRDLAALGYRRFLFYDYRGHLHGECSADEEQRLDGLMESARQQDFYYYDVCCFPERDAAAIDAFLAREHAHDAGTGGGGGGGGPRHIVLFSPIPFDDLHQRPQKLAESFCERGAHVLYVEPAGGRAAARRGVAFLLGSVLSALVLHLRALPEVLAGRRVAARTAVRAGAGATTGNAAGLEVIRCPLAIPVHKTASPLLNALTVAVHRRFLERSVLGRFPADAPVAALVEQPFWGAVLEPGDFRAVFYDCLDDTASFAGRGPATRLHAWEERLLGLCAGAFATARGLEERLRALRPALAVVRAPNGVDVDWFQRQAERTHTTLPASGSGRPVVGYVGVIGRWLDYDVIDAAVGGCPEMDFVFVGPAGEPAALERLQRRPNFRWIPRRPYEDVPGLVRRLDVCLIPFAQGAIARTTNPVKLFEYFALGKPVVTTPLVELEEYRAGRLVYWAPGAAAFVAAIREAAAESDDALRAKRVQVARENTWQARAAGMLSAIEAAVNAAQGAHVVV